MSTQPLTTQNTQNPAQNVYGIDPHQILNMTMTNVISEQMIKIVKSTTGLTFGKICKLFAIMSLDEIRKSIMNMIKHLFTYISTNHLSIIEWINKNILQNTFVICIKQITNYITSLFAHPVKKLVLTENTNNSIVIQPTENKININLTPSITFIQILIEHIKKYKNTQCEKRTLFNIVPIHKITIENVENIILGELWSDIEINYENTVINIENDLNVVFNAHKKGKKISEYSSTNTHKIILTDVMTLSDFVPDKEIKKKIRQFVTEYGKNTYLSDIYGVNGVYRSTNKTNYSFMDNIYFQFNWFPYALFYRHEPPISQVFYETCFIEFLSNKCPKLNLLTSSIELLLIIQYYNFTFNTFQKMPIENLLIFDTNIEVEKTDIQFNQCPNPVQFKQWKDKDKKLFLDLYHKIFQDQTILINVITWNNNKATTLSTNKVITFNIGSKTHSKIELYEKFQKFVNYINSYIDQSDIKKPVKSYIIKVDTLMTKTSVPNKKYIEYKKQKDALLELDNFIKDDKNKGSEISDMDLYRKKSEFMKLTIPPEEKKKIITEKKIVIIEINEIYKSFDTLYLREHDKYKLQNVLQMYKEDNDTWKEMGIPNKLGILLHGIMGTGKSSAISAIATYLQKNLYCVDFKTIKTNGDFLMVVDYVNKNCLGGGILTFEDFDAMGNVLHKRVDDFKATNSNVDLYNSSKQELTLDFILNVFQGSMTPSGFVFVGTTNHLDVLDEALYRDGRFDIKIEMKMCDYYQIQCIYYKLIGRTIKEEILNKIDENKWTPANIIFRIIHYCRGDHTDEIILEPFLNS